MTKLDILIPTKNRHQTLMPVVNAILSTMHSQDYRIIVHDNTPFDNRPSFLNLPQDPRFIYYHEQHDIDVVENWNRVIDKAESEFVILIGDDDLVLPNVFKAISVMERYGFDCLIQQRPTYYWPGVKFDREFDYFSPSSLLISRDITSSVVELSPVKELNFVLDKGAVYLYKLPALYHGLLRTSILKQIREKYGTYVLGPSPDISLALLIVHSVQRCGIYGTPFSVAGASFNSAAGMGRRGAHSAKLDKVPDWLPKGMDRMWDPALPRIWNGLTVYAQSLYMVGQRANLPVLINYEALYKKLLTNRFLDINLFYGRNRIARTPRLRTVFTSFFGYILRTTILHMPKNLLNVFVRRHPAFRFQAFYTNIKSPKACIQMAMFHIDSFYSDRR